MLRCLASCVLLLLPTLGLAAELDVQPGDGAVSAAIAKAADGDILRLRPGTYHESLVLDRPLTIDGGGKAVLEGTGAGSVITVTGPDVVVQGLTIQGSGSSHQTIDSGVQLTKTADRTVVRDNILLGNLYGVDIHGAKEALV